MATTGTDELVIGIDVGGTEFKGAVIDRQGHIYKKERRSAQRRRGSEAVVAAILDFAADLSQVAGEMEGDQRVVGAGVAVPGLVDEKSGVALLSVNLGWKDVPLRRLLEERLRVKAVVGHDVRTASVAERLIGAARGSDDYMLVTLGTGIGAAVVLRGEPYLGVHGSAGEFGHIVIQPDGPECSCGRHGCLETLASASAVVERYRDRTGCSNDVTTRDVAERVKQGDEVAGKVWSEAVEALGLGLANYVTLLDPERIVIGGGMADAGEMLFEPLKAVLAREICFEPVPPVLPAALGNDAGYLGAALSAWLALGISRNELNWNKDKEMKEGML
ncbi:MAG TPA: ROK family protein [Ktedonobacteraceae bacterium]|nr:ROK family protein [Ktedonobacteraceae bacterium]